LVNKPEFLKFLGDIFGLVALGVNLATDRYCTQVANVENPNYLKLPVLNFAKRELHGRLGDC